MRRHNIDYQNLMIDVQTKQGKKTYSVREFPMEVYQWLACYGLAKFLEFKVDPDEAYKRLAEGRIGGRVKTRYPLTVKAMSAVLSVPVEAAWKQWRAFSPEERRDMRKNPDIAKAMIDLR